MAATKENARGQGGRKETYRREMEHVQAHESNHAPAQAGLTPSFDVEGLIRAGLTLIPLHRWNTIDARGRQRGKSPLDPAWQAKDYDSREVLERARRAGLNVGVRLPPNWVVLDVDPRNFPEGRDTLAELVRDAGLDLSQAPHVRTGSGGHHYYFRKPADVQLLDSLEDYPGLEFKSHGRQVVAPGSIHPCGRSYEWDDLAPFPEEAPPMPDRLLAMARRPVRAHGEAAGFGELTPEKLAETLEQLDPTDFSAHDDWLALMMACHHATAGEGRQEFIDWSTQDPKFLDDAWIIGRRWDSLHMSGSRGGRPITIKFLHKVVQEAGGHVAQPDPEDDFEMVAVEEGDQLPTLRRMKNGKPESSFPNCLKLVRHIDSQLGLVYDEFGCGVHLVAPELPWRVDVGRRLDDDVVRRIRQYLVEITDMNWSKEDVLEAVLTLARENPVHPVRDYLAGLKWDGVPRLDTLLVKYAGATDNAYVRAIGAKALIAAVRRVRQPGCKFDNVIVLEGSQGCGKSSFVKSLSPNIEWFSDSPIGNTESKDAPLSLQGRWIIELGEMSVLSKSGVEALKAFVSSSIDHVRRPYGRLHEELRRQCIFIGTTNQASYLKDQTGNRRFWPVKVGTIDLDALLADRDQLWAEAAAREVQGESLLLPQELWDVAAVEQEERVADDPWVDIVRAYLDRSTIWDGKEIVDVEPLDRVHSATLLSEALSIRPGDQRPEHTQRLKVVMEKHLGWKHKSNLRAGPDGKQGRGYLRQ